MKKANQLTPVQRLLPVPAGIIGIAVGGSLKVASHESRPSILVGAALLGTFTTAIAYFVPRIEDSSEVQNPQLN